jgi:hypothetical protein
MDFDQVTRWRRTIILASALGIVILFFMGSLSVVLFPGIMAAGG